MKCQVIKCRNKYKYSIRLMVATIIDHKMAVFPNIQSRMGGYVSCLSEFFKEHTFGLLGKYSYFLALNRFSSLGLKASFFHQLLAKSLPLIPRDFPCSCGSLQQNISMIYHLRFIILNYFKQGNRIILAKEPSHGILFVLIP